MRSIEVLTTQNVSIVYELASVRDRAIAFFIDSVIIWGSIILVTTLLSINGWTANRTVLLLLISLFAVPVFFFYTLMMEVFNNGQSIGKKALKLKVIKIDGQETSINDYMLRALFRTLDIYFSVGSIAAIMISSSESSQRLGDMFAHTTVIRLKPTLDMELRDLLKIGSPDGYVPQYPAVRLFNDQQMLLAKTVVERAHTYYNGPHIEALNLMAAVLGKKLGLHEIPADKQQFIKTILKDYVILTR